MGNSCRLYVGLVIHVLQSPIVTWSIHDDIIKWKHFPCYWPFVRGIHRSPVNSPHKGQWRGALMFSLICIWINGWVNNHEAGDLRRYHAHYDGTVMFLQYHITQYWVMWYWFLPTTHKTSHISPIRARERERLSLSAFLRTEDIGVHIFHISRLIITYTLE